MKRLLSAVVAAAFVSVVGLGPAMAQPTAPAAPAPASAPAAAPAPAPAVSAAASEAAKQAALEEAKKKGGQTGEAMSMAKLWEKLNDVEKFVIILLGLSTVWTLVLMAEKIFVMNKTNKQIKEFLAAFRKANSVEEGEAIVRKLEASGIKTMFDSGMAEVRKTQDLGLYTLRDARDHTMQRVSAAMTVKQNEHIEDIGSSMTFLASIGSNAPFIGLFGTVWGIMNSFLGIVASQSTSLVAVAPGIAGALLATAVGLVAAIPAVLVYNFAAKQISKISGKYDDFASEFIALVSRDMDRRSA
jgi:biopolymer transport protein ExbB/TolQ